MFNAYKSALVAICIAAIPVTASAAETLQVVSGPEGGRKITISAYDPIGQSFTAFTDTISSIGFQFSALNPGSPNTPLTLNLFAGETLTGTSLFTQSFTLPTTITSRNDVEWVDIALPDLAVMNGAFYTAVLTATSSRAALATGPGYDPLTGEFTGGDAYAGGRLLAGGRTLYANCIGAGNNCDANFRVTGDLAASAVPEPSTWAMLLLGFGAMGGVVRRRHAVARAALA